MIVDTSAIIAIVRAETDAGDYARALTEAGPARLSAASYLEATTVVDAARDPVASRRLDELLQVAGVTRWPPPAVSGDRKPLCAVVY